MTIAAPISCDVDIGLPQAPAKVEDAKVNTELGFIYTALKSLQSIISARVFGFGQTRQNVTASRSLGTTYYNTTSKPIEVIISGSFNGAGGYYIVSVGGAITAYSANAYAATALVGAVTVMVLPGESYIVNQYNSVFSYTWIEVS